MKSKYNKIIIHLTVVFVLLFSFVPVAIASSHEPVTLTIFHVNDRHGRMTADPYISHLIEETPGNVLVLDAGDAIHGQTTTNLTGGEAMVELMNMVGYAAMVPGNHEFNFGIQRLMELSDMMDFPLLAANVRLNGENIFQTHVVFRMDGLRVGIFGIVTPETKSFSDPRIMSGISIEDPKRTALIMVETLKNEGCDIIIALAHLGDDDSSLPQDKSDALAVPGVDVVIDGHSHTKLEHGRMVGDTLIVQAGDHGWYIGVVEIIMHGDDITKSAKLIEVDEKLPLDEAVVAKIGTLDESVADIISEVVGYTPVLLNGEREDVRTGETNLSNMITDSMRYISNADFAFISGGTIRDSIPPGDITMGHVLNTMPFSNLIVTIDLRGAAIWEALEHGVSEYPESDGLFLQQSGLFVEFNPDAPVGKRITSATTPDGSPLDLDKVYTVAMVDYLAAGGDGYTMFQSGENLTYFGGDAEAFVAYLETRPDIKPEAEGRLIIEYVVDEVPGVISEPDVVEDVTMPDVIDVVEVDVLDDEGFSILFYIGIIATGVAVVVLIVLVIVRVRKNS